jgi:hypothetical protein
MLRRCHTARPYPRSVNCLIDEANSGFGIIMLVTCHSESSDPKGDTDGSNDTADCSYLVSNAQLPKIDLPLIPFAPSLHSRHTNQP